MMHGGNQNFPMPDIGRRGACFPSCSIRSRFERSLILETKPRLAFRHDHERGIMIHICYRQKQDGIQVVISKTFRTSVNGIGTGYMEFRFIRQRTSFKCLYKETGTAVYVRNSLQV